MKSIYRVALALVGGGLILGVAGLTDPRPLFFASAESRTLKGHPVYNEIRRRHVAGRDLWIMRQSHAGATLPLEARDLLAIEIDTTRGEARFFQLAPSLEDPSHPSERPPHPYRAACLSCHPSGLRAIRPMETPEVRLSAWDRWRLQLWNLRIQVYGSLRPVEGHQPPAPGGAPFSLAGELNPTPLTQASCLRCHNGETRGRLNRQHAGSIRHLVESGAMPPFPFSLSEDERQSLEFFVEGF